MKLNTNIVFIPMLYGGDLIPVTKDIADEINWVAVDSDGRVHGYVNEPELITGSSIWTCYDGGWYYLGTVDLDDDDLPWDSLIWKVSHDYT